MPILKSLDEYAKRVEKEMPLNLQKRKLLKEKNVPSATKNVI